MRKGIWWITDAAAEHALERRAIAVATSRLSVYFLFVMALISGVLFIAALSCLPPKRALLDGVPDDVLLLLVGIIGFALFFPWFLAAYIGRHLLNSVKTLERQIAELTQTQKRGSGAAD